MPRGRLAWIGQYRRAIEMHDDGLGRVPGAHFHRQRGAVTNRRHESGRHGRADQDSRQDQQRQQNLARAQLVQAAVHGLSVPKRVHAP